MALKQEILEECSHNNRDGSNFTDTTQVSFKEFVRRMSQMRSHMSQVFPASQHGFPYCSFKTRK